MAASTIALATGTPRAPTTNQVTVAATATAVVSADSARESLLLVNGGDATIYLGGSDVSTSNGLILPAGVPLLIDQRLGCNGAWYAIVAADTEPLSYLAC